MVLTTSESQTPSCRGKHRLYIKMKRSHSEVALDETRRPDIATGKMSGIHSSNILFVVVNSISLQWTVHWLPIDGYLH